MLKQVTALSVLVILSATAVCQNKTYTIQKGDTDSSISKKYSLTVHQLHLLNPKTEWRKLRPGKKLNVGNTKGIQAGKNLTEAKKTSAHAGSIKEEPDILVQSYSVQKVAQNAQEAVKGLGKNTGYGTYKVRPGDYDWLIASRIGISPSKLRAINPSTNWSRLSIGTVIKIPVVGIAKGSTHVAYRPIRSRYAKTMTDGVVIRRGPTTASEKVTVVEAGKLVSLLDRSNGWYKCKFPKGSVGWVRGDLLKPAKAPVIEKPRRTSASSYVAYHRSHRRTHRSTEIVASNPDGKNRLLAQAFSLRGVPYRYGQSSRRGSDCSGFTSLVYRSQGVQLPRTSREQSHVGAKIDRGALKEGDLVFFKTNRGTRINHVGIYIGGGKFIHASSGGGKVQVNSLAEGYYKRRYATARRVAKHKK